MSGKKEKKVYSLSSLENQVILSETIKGLNHLPDQSIDLILTSPEPFSLEGKKGIYEDYPAYLRYMTQVIRECKRVLHDGRFFAITASHVLLPRKSRSESSQRIAVIFDLHRIFMEEGFAFVDDIILTNADGSGRMSGRGRFSVDRNPLQYKPQPVADYLMIYRKDELLIDHFIHDHPNKELVEASRIADGYEKTNIWSLPSDPEEKYNGRLSMGLAERVVQYYSFVKDVVLDPFAGNGITARAAAGLKRRFCMVESEPLLADYMIGDLMMRGSNFINPFDFSFTDLRKEDEHAPDGI